MQRSHWNDVSVRGMCLWLAAWWLSLLWAIFNVILPLAVQRAAVCRARCSLCGDQRDPPPQIYNTQRKWPDLTPPNFVLALAEPTEDAADWTRWNQTRSSWASVLLHWWPLCRWLSSSIGPGKVIPQTEASLTCPCCCHWPHLGLFDYQGHI